MADFSQFGPRKPVRGGARARGGFGRTWWGKALLEAVEKVADAGRLSRGRTYARVGQVVNYRVERGAVTAEVQGSQPSPFTSVLSVRPLRDEEIDLLLAEIREAPGMLAEIASGALPPALGPHLLPTTASELDFSCTCPDMGWPCKHVAAVCYLLAERLDEQPGEILTLRGLDLDTLIGGVERSTRTADSGDPYGDRLTLPDLPRVEFHPVIEDLDAMALRRALRMSSEDEQTAATGLRELRSLYAEFDS
ncbi:SWIM zinc finger family protein [Nocardia caishijiensis]|uniref:Zn finger protein n=1 Tax=Nocardia caishijiensis TaxID=184756 RepID=A0ABQ6YSJ9_9NOCA|nr:SWIM zinc finger family protein [Nocardia caishijiensis]KAF0848540.1 putative Zn finger protein [Nocardia caishijiensis]